MRLFEMKDEYNPSSYDREKKKRCFESNLELTTFIITEIWKMNDTIALAYKDLSLALNILDKNEKIKMSKGLNKVADDLERITKELREHCSKEIKTVEVEE